MFHLLALADDLKSWGLIMARARAQLAWANVYMFQLDNFNAAQQ